MRGFSSFRPTHDCPAARTLFGLLLPALFYFVALSYWTSLRLSDSYGSRLASFLTAEHGSYRRVFLWVFLPFVSRRCHHSTFVICCQHFFTLFCRFFLKSFFKSPFRGFLPIKRTPDKTCLTGAPFLYIILKTAVTLPSPRSAGSYPVRPSPSLPSRSLLRCLPAL